MSAEGYTVLIVEQNIRQVLKVVDRAYLLETGRINASGTAAELLASERHQAGPTWGSDRSDGHRSSTSSCSRRCSTACCSAACSRCCRSGLNLIFGVIDVVWICYAELIMIGMYAVY